MASPIPLSLRCRGSAAGMLALVAALLLPCTTPVRAQSEPTQDRKVLSDKVREGMQKFGPLEDAKNWDQAIALLTDLQKIAQPDSYEEYLLAWVKGQVYLTMDQNVKAIEPLETALRVLELHTFSEDNVQRKILGFLSKIYYGEATSKGVPADKQAAYFLKAGEALKKLIAIERDTHTVSTDDIVFYAYLLLTRAQVNPDKPDPVLIKEAQALAEEGLLLDITPKPQLYQMLLNTLLAQNEYKRAAEILEFQLKKDPKDPKNKDNWSQLNNIYLTLAADAKDNKEEAFEYSMRSIVTYERAQAAGFLKTPKDYFGLVSVYYNIGQIELAAKLLETDLKNGYIESDQKYWTYLAQWYQQVDQPLKAIDVLKEAAKHFPDSGEFDFMAATNYFALEKFPEAYEQAKVAATKGVGDKTWNAWALMAYTAFTELRHYDDALVAVTKAMSFPESKKDSQLPGLKNAVEKAIKDRNDQIEALKASQKS